MCDPYNHNPFKENHVIEFDKPTNEFDANRQLLLTAKKSGRVETSVENITFLIETLGKLAGASHIEIKTR